MQLPPGFPARFPVTLLILLVFIWFLNTLWNGSGMKRWQFFGCRENERESDGIRASQTLFFFGCDGMHESGVSDLNYRKVRRSLVFHKPVLSFRHQHHHPSVTSRST